MVLGAAQEEVRGRRGAGKGGKGTMPPKDDSIIIFYIKNIYINILIIIKCHGRALWACLKRDTTFRSSERLQGPFAFRSSGRRPFQPFFVFALANRIMINETHRKERSASSLCASLRKNELR